MFHIVLHRPEIPPNTGNLMRLCVNTGNRLHLIRPLGFELEDARLRRAGLDYREFADVSVYDDLGEFLAAVQPSRLFAFTQHAQSVYADVEYRDGDALLFGRESDGLPDDVLEHPAVTERLRIPIAPGWPKRVQEYNEIALKVMERSPEIELNDLYAFTKPNHAKWWRRADNVHFNPKGSQAQGEEVARVILRSLEQGKAKSKE